MPARSFYRTALWTLAAFAGLLAVIGIYGIVSYAVVQRTREIGVRIAMGATPGKIRIVLLRQGLLMVMSGANPGIVIARLLGQFLRSVVEGAKPLNAAGSIDVVLSLILVARWASGALQTVLPNSIYRLRCEPSKA
jgi:ABC-type antimicrobial peptide transport system permease subunit